MQIFGWRSAIYSTGTLPPDARDAFEYGPLQASRLA